MDQLDMLLCTLPAEETFEWGRRGDRRPLEDLPDLFYDFCWERAAELRAQIKSVEGIKEEPRVSSRRHLRDSLTGIFCVLYRTDRHRHQESSTRSGTPSVFPTGTDHGHLYIFLLYQHLIYKSDFNYCSICRKENL